MPERDEAPVSGAVIALGAWLKNAACRLAGDAAEWSSLHGDLGDARACAALEAGVRAWLGDGASPVAAFAHDLHPDFFSTRLALTLAHEHGVPAIGVQHHHAHIAALCAEHGVHEPVIGLALDGVGLGTDGQAWGGELLWVDGAAWQRLGHLRTLALPGGDVAAREPWRMAASLLHAMGRGDEIGARFGATLGAARAQGVRQLLDRGLNCPPTSSAGRWFDAAAAALGLSLRQSHEAEAAIALQACAARWLDAGRAPLALARPVIGADQVLDLAPSVACLFDTPADTVDAASAGFHVTLADALADWAGAAAARHGVATVGLGGGCFLNALLRERVTLRLRARGLRVLRAERHTCGDAALALGQAWVAARQLGLSPSSTTGRVVPPPLESLPCA